MRPPTSKDKENGHMLLFSTRVVIYSCRIYIENYKIQTKIMMNTIKKCSGCFSFKFKGRLFQSLINTSNINFKNTGNSETHF